MELGRTAVTGRERVVAAYKGGYADRVPAYPIAGSFAGCLDGLSIEEYCTNPTKAVRAMLNYYERYQPDIMVAFNDLAKEAEAVGCRVKYSDYVVPSIDQHVLQEDKGRLARMEIPDPKKAGRLPAFLEQCEALSAARLPSGLGAVLVGPWTIAMLLRNPEIMCLDTIDDPAFVHDLMRFSTEYAKQVGDAVLETKIGLSYSDPTASCSLVGPDTYREFIRPYHRELVEYFRAKKVGTTVHICGTTHQIHEDLVDVGFVAITIDLDQQGDPALKVDQLDRLITLGNQRGVVAIGNVDVTIFERATKAEIEAEVKRCIDTAGKRSRFVLSTSCELPPRADPECVKWMMDAAGVRPLRPYSLFLIVSSDVEREAAGRAVGSTGPRGTRSLLRGGWAPSGCSTSAVPWRERVRFDPTARPAASRSTRLSVAQPNPVWRSFRARAYELAVGRTTRHAFAAPRRLGSIPTRDVRVHLTGTCLVDPTAHPQLCAAER